MIPKKRGNIRMNKHLFLKRILWTAFFVVIYQMGQHIYIPTIDIFSAQQALGSVPFFRLVALTTGGQMSVPMILSLGMRPYMTGMIIWQAVMAMDLDSVKRMTLRQQGYVQRLITLVLAIIQSVEMVYAMDRSFKPFYLPGTEIDISMVIGLIVLIAGALFTTWLADLNAQKGLGGTVALILPGIFAGLPETLHSGLGVVFPQTMQNLIWVAVVTVIFVVIIVFLNQGELRIPIQRPLLEASYASSYLPIRFFTAGAMPFMFATSFFSFPRYFINSTMGPVGRWQKIIFQWTSFSTIQGIMLYGLVTILLGYAFGLINLQPTDEAKQLKESGDYIFGTYPGDSTEHLIMHHFWLLSFWSNLVLLLVAVGPLIVGLKIPGVANFSPFLGSIMILVTIIDTIKEQVLALWNKDRYHII